LDGGGINFLWIEVILVGVGWFDFTVASGDDELILIFGKFFLNWFI
jgi:hypothetical protein